MQRARPSLFFTAPYHNPDLNMLQSHITRIIQLLAEPVTSKLQPALPFGRVPQIDPMAGIASK
jgi:hypothetical protein